MALTECWECGKTVSEDAETCPHCGIKSPGWKPPPEVEGVPVSKPETSPTKKKSGCGKSVAWVFVILVALVIFGGIINGLQDAGVLPTPTPRPPPTITPTPAPTPIWEEWKDSAQEIAYESLFRYAEDHKGKRVYYRGKVVQVIEERGDFQLRVNVTPGDYGFWDDTIFLRYDDAPVRILEDDVIAFVGRMNGTITYESVLGGDITIPDITVLSLIIETE